MKIPATVVTGFLGAGKTSLLRHLVSDARGKRLALIINEFGELGADREILLGCGIPACREEDIVELANGCICCTVADDFLPTIERLIERREPPEHIVIETSGLALPKPLIKAFTWPEVRSRVSVDGVIAVIDAEAVADGRFAADPGAIDARRRADPALDHASPIEELFADQLAAADLVVLNKRDLVEPEALARVERTIAAGLRPGVKVVRASHGRLPAHALLGLGAGAEDDLANRPSHHDGAADEHGHDEFESVSLPLGPVADVPGLARRIEGLAATHGVLRVKGFLEVPGRSRRLVLQGVGSRVQHYFDRPWRADEP
ncbi:MAG: cobalamin biosynthesis protein CobW, partial [Alphaproteobacteria bacterium]